MGAWVPPEGGPPALRYDCLLVGSRPPETVTWASRGAGLHTMHTWRFLPHPEGCLVEMSEEFDGRGARSVRPLVRWFWGYQLRAFRRHVSRRDPGGEVPRS